MSLSPLPGIALEPLANEWQVKLPITLTAETVTGALEYIRRFADCCLPPFGGGARPMLLAMFGVRLKFAPVLKVPLIFGLGQNSGSRSG